MKKIAASGFVAAVALATVLLGSATADPPMAPSGPQAHATAIQNDARGVPTEALPDNGQCKIWYDELSPARQPAQMDCEHANWLAHTWGGRVIETSGNVASEQASYRGRNDFRGVPETSLPRRGYCRAWLNDVTASQQPAESDCRVARQIAERDNGRVLFMPL